MKITDFKTNKLAGESSSEESWIHKAHKGFPSEMGMNLAVP